MQRHKVPLLTSLKLMSYNLTMITVVADYEDAFKESGYSEKALSHGAQLPLQSCILYLVNIRKYIKVL